MSSQKLRFVLARYLPPQALDYCVKIWEEKTFDLTITPKRSTKLGDYSYDSKTKRHKVTVNGDLNPYSFLVTYIHEVAHFKTYIKHGFAVKPHGKEWKQEFSSLMNPMLKASVFPEYMNPALKKYFSNPKASSCSDIELLKALKTEDNYTEQELFLSEIVSGQAFVFNNRTFVKELTKRTRALCLEPQTGKKFLISEAASVKLTN